jgi:arylsulfatase A-like enzyme
VFYDFPATAAAIAGAKAQPGTDSVSVLPLLTGAKQTPHEFLYWEANLFDQKAGKMRDDRLAQAVRMGDWKAVRTKPGAPLELYNLRTDQGEQKDLAAAKPEVVAKIEAYLKGARTTPRPHNTGSMQWVK